MNKTQARRIRRLARFLRNRVPRKAFRFTTILLQLGLPPLRALKAGGGCGTVACAFGWAPAAFPKHLRWSNKQFVVARGLRGIEKYRVAERFFAENEKEWDRLFLPGRKIDGCSGLPHDATPKMVAAHLEREVARVAKAKGWVL